MRLSESFCVRDSGSSDGCNIINFGPLFRVLGDEFIYNIELCSYNFTTALSVTHSKIHIVKKNQPM